MHDLISDSNRWAEQRDDVRSYSFQAGLFYLVAGCRLSHEGLNWANLHFTPTTAKAQMPFGQEHPAAMLQGFRTTAQSYGLQVFLVWGRRKAQWSAADYEEKAIKSKKIKKTEVTRLSVTFIDGRLLREKHVTWIMSKRLNFAREEEPVLGLKKTKKLNMGVVCMFSYFDEFVQKLFVERLFGFLYCPIHGRLFST